MMFLKWKEENSLDQWNLNLALLWRSTLVWAQQRLITRRYYHNSPVGTPLSGVCYSSLLRRVPTFSSEKSTSS
jgi:hypothetical protein